MRSILTLLVLSCNALLCAQEGSRIDLKEVFRGSPIIYSTLALFSLFAFVLWMYTLLTFKASQVMPAEFLKAIRDHVLEKKYDAALAYCQRVSNLSAVILASGIATRKHGHQVMMEAMQAEGKRCSAPLWQRISLLNDIAVIAPMLGLLGTVLGMFYAFYDVNRSPDTLASIFDGLGMAVGTTVAGLLVSILATIFYTTLRFRIVRLLNTVENEALAFGHLIDNT